MSEISQAGQRLLPRLTQFQPSDYSAGGLPSGNMTFGTTPLRDLMAGRPAQPDAAAPQAGVRSITGQPTPQTGNVQGAAPGNTPDRPSANADAPAAAVPISSWAAAGAALAGNQNTGDPMVKAMGVLLGLAKQQGLSSIGPQNLQNHKQVVDLVQVLLRDDKTGATMTALTALAGELGLNFGQPSLVSAAQAGSAQNPTLGTTLFADFKAHEKDPIDFARQQEKPAVTQGPVATQMPMPAPTIPDLVSMESGDDE
ncbi:MAG: hypothetical protein RL341_2091 [Pseudomonadota bacterium]|jgi:hypothetical protein